MFGRYGTYSEQSALNDIHGPIPTYFPQNQSILINGAGCFFLDLTNVANGEEVILSQFLVFAIPASSGPAARPADYSCHGDCPIVPVIVYTTAVASLTVPRPSDVGFLSLVVPEIGHTDDITGKLQLPSNTSGTQYFVGGVILQQY
jgi:hypothetical protein